MLNRWRALESYTEFTAVKCRWHTNLPLQLRCQMYKFRQIASEILYRCNGLANTVPKTKSDVLNQIIWNNRYIKINKKSVFFQILVPKRVKKCIQPHRWTKNAFFLFSLSKTNFHLDCNFLQYYWLICDTWSLERTCKITYRRTLIYSKKATPNIEDLTCKAKNNLLINQKNLPPPTADKKLVKCGFDPSQRRKVYSLPFGTTKEVKLSVFQFKVIHNNLSTNSLLYKMKNINSPNCSSFILPWHWAIYFSFICLLSIGRIFLEWIYWVVSLNKQKNTVWQHLKNAK